MKNKNSTRYFSSQQEKKIAKTVGGRLQPNSGATLFKKGDIQTDKWLYEAKTCMKEQQQFTIKKEWLDKLKQEAFGMKKEFFALVFNFGTKNGENFYILNERIFKQVLDLLEELEELESKFMSTDEERLVTDNINLAYKIAWLYYKKSNFRFELEELQSVALLRIN